MPVYRETAVFAAGRLELRLEADLRYVLRYGDLVEYANGRRRSTQHGGRWMPYAFRSVEQLRYDFERDVIAAGGRLGEAP